MGDSGKLRFYELDHESEMRLLKTHSHTSNGLAMEPGKREEKQLRETQTLQLGKPPIKNMSRTAGVAGGGGSRKGSAAKKPQKRPYDKANLCRKEGGHRRQCKGEVMPKPPADHWHGGG